MLKVLLDTDIISYLLKGNQAVFNHLQDHLNQNGMVCTSIINYYEIKSGLSAADKIKQLRVFEQMIDEIEILDLTENSIEIAVNIYANLRKKGTPVDDIDILIASIAMSNEIPVVTNNFNHFGKIQGIQLLNWMI